MSALPAHKPARRMAPVAAFAQKALDLLLPPRCPGTGEIVDHPGMVSPAFWRDLAFIESPFCGTCGLPFPHPVAEGALCGACLDHAPAFDAARAAVAYNDASRRLILDFKYGDKIHAAGTFLPWMIRSGAQLIDACDVIVPVPLHPLRLWQRRFNQSAVLATALARHSGKPHSPDALLRRRATKPQKGLKRAERLKNVKGAFAANPKRRADIAGKNILLIDDVFTSGATLDECAKALKAAGAAAVYILTLARVTREDF